MKPENLPFIKVVQRLFPGKGEIQCLQLLHSEGFSICTLGELVKAEADDNYTNFHLSCGRKLTASHTLGDYEAFLTALGFYRISKSAMVNLQHVWDWGKPKKRGGSGRVKLSTGEWLPVSRRCKAGFLELFEAGKGEEPEENPDEGPGES